MKYLPRSPSLTKRIAASGNEIDSIIGTCACAVATTKTSTYQFLDITYNENLNFNDFVLSKPVFPVPFLSEARKQATRIVGNYNYKVILLKLTQQATQKYYWWYSLSRHQK